MNELLGEKMNRQHWEQSLMKLKRRAYNSYVTRNSRYSHLFTCGARKTKM